jgi:type I restriction enzyme M protein
MLNADTKRRIDNARDILVGKVPDPKTQVEQITFAMIYKFMDDMDQLSVKLGGKATFFNNDYEAFAWSKLMDKKLSGIQRLDLYVRALEGMSNNPFIPQLFRDVFKGAFLPYRDSETLNLFLKEMNGFTYDHSEDLGDAYEYLLSIFGTQGKAGQFRTPRHIIDFIVDCVDPDLHDSVLDPACGTAGFLISAYKHVSEKYHQNPLTPDQKQRLTENFVGYDISPDMVRLSRVNMYLHQFPNPTIHEYDTLTTEDRWDETFDVILANPPFMTPKGGIRPHKRFAVRANRSEVLFVDYIAEHLNVGGRAGVIVPEGIIFQSSNAYKALRKMLVEQNYLYAVVSLPAGVFNPYSGVKTSILLLDKDLARRAERILFVRVEQDGYDLGAQRREIEPNDLPEALAAVKAFQAEPAAEPENSARAWTVEKARLGEDGDYNLSGERYRQTVLISRKWPMTPLGDVVTIESGSREKGGAKDFGIPSIGGGQIAENGSILIEKMVYISEEHYRSMTSGILKKNDVLMVKDGATTGKIGFFKSDNDASVNEHVFLLRSHTNILPIYLYHTLKSTQFQNNMQPYIKGIIGGVSLEIRKIKIPLPPLEVQQEIVDEIEGYQKVIDGARQVVENYKPVIPIDPDWPLVKLGEVCEVINGSTPSRKTPEFWENGTVPWFTVADIRKNGRRIFTTLQHVTQKAIDETSLNILPEDAVLICCTASVGEHAIAKTRLTTNQQFNGLIINNKYRELLLPDFLYFLAGNFKEQLMSLGGSTAFKHISAKELRTIIIPIPPMKDQEKILADLEQEEFIVESNKNLIDRFEAKIAARIQSVWGGGENK